MTFQKHFSTQQPKHMGSSAQNSSGVHWCRRRVRFNKVPEKDPNVLEKVWEVLVQSQVKFNRVPEKVPGFGAEPGHRVPEKVPEKVLEQVWKLWCVARSGSTEVPVKVWEALVQSQVKFNSVLEKVPEKVPEKVWEALVQSQVRFNRVPEKVPGKIPGGFGAEAGQVQQGSGEGSGEGSRKPGYKAKSSSVPETAWEALVQSQVRFNRVSEKVPEKVWEALVQPVWFNKVPEKVLGEGLGGFDAEPSQVQQGSGEGS